MSGSASEVNHSSVNRGMRSGLNPFRIEVTETPLTTPLFEFDCGVLPHCACARGTLCIETLFNTQVVSLSSVRRRHRLPALRSISTSDRETGRFEVCRWVIAARHEHWLRAEPVWNNSTHLESRMVNQVLMRACRRQLLRTIGGKLGKTAAI
jgi:hypothetical protein